MQLHILHSLDTVRKTPLAPTLMVDQFERDIDYITADRAHDTIAQHNR